MDDRQPPDSQRNRPLRYRRVYDNREQLQTRSDGEHADADDPNQDVHGGRNHVNSNIQRHLRSDYSRRAGGDNRHPDNARNDNLRPRRPPDPEKNNFRHTAQSSRAHENVSHRDYSSHENEYRQQQHSAKTKVEPRSVVDGVDETLSGLNSAKVNADERPPLSTDKGSAAPSTTRVTSCNVCLMSRREPIFGVLDEACNHFFCYVCAVRLRTICRDKRCPICRVETEHIRLARMLPSTSPVGLGKSSNGAGDDDPTFEKTTYKIDGEAGLVYATERIHNIVNEQLFRHKCPKCPYTSAAFSYLEQHVKQTHDLFYCHVCVKHLNLFTYERRTYGKEALFDHMRTGDSIAGSAMTHGHPRCQICNVRSFDRDEQLRHNRREHHVCYCCEWGPKRKIVVFEDLVSMRKHMKKDHFVCEMDVCGEIDPPRAFNERQDLELHQVESHNRRNLSADLFFNQSFRNIEPAPSSNAGPSRTSSASANDRAASVTTSLDAPALGRPTGGPAPLWTSGRDSATGMARPVNSRGAFAAQPEEFPTISGENSRDPLETMLFARRLNETNLDAQYPRLQLENAVGLHDALKKKSPKPKPHTISDNRADGASSSRSAKPQPQKRQEDFPVLASNVRLPPGLPQPSTAATTPNAASSSTAKKSADSSANNTFAARAQQKPTSSAGTARDNEVKSAKAATQPTPKVNGPKTDDAVKTKETLQTGRALPEVKPEPVNEFPSLGITNSARSSHTQNRAVVQPRWAAVAQAPNGGVKKSKEQPATTVDAVDQTAALLKRLTSSSRSSAASAMDAADRYNQMLASGNVADDDEAPEAFPSMTENNERARSDMGPWWRRADEKQSGSKKKIAKTVWKNK